jgi:hypothetical protein
MVEWYLQEKTPNSSTRALWHSYQQSSGSKSWGIWPLKPLCSYLKVIFACRRNLQHGANTFNSPLKEGMLQIFVALKNSSPQPGFNPWTLGSVVSTLTITPPRWLLLLLNNSVFSLLSKNENRLIKSPVCVCVCVCLSVCLSVCVCVPLITFEPLGRFSWYLVLR